MLLDDATTAEFQKLFEAVLGEAVPAEDTHVIVQRLLILYDLLLRPLPHAKAGTDSH